MKKRILSAILASLILVSLSSCAGGSSSESQSGSSQTSSASSQQESSSQTPSKSDVKLVGEYELSPEIATGTILHAWCWSFNTIKANLKDIAEAGYTAVQTSPINECKVGENGGMQLQDVEDSENNGKWYYHYQPTNYTIGNYQLGTEEEFKELCQEAEKYGIKIIVDAVVNHMTSDINVISEDIFNITDEPFHNSKDITDYNNRKQVTQGNLLGLKDLNTQDPKMQQYILSYLKKCVEDGASGFRYDATKHIELSDDPEEYASDFWNVILDNGAEFQYGEVLQGGADRSASYADLLNITSATYGQYIRNSIANLDVSTTKWSDYGVNGLDPNKLVTWVESHDNYCNDGSWAQLTEDDVKHGWAIIAARSGGTPLFFSRPAGASIDSQWGNNKIGEEGSEFYKSKEVAEVNKFRNHMIGLDETISNPMDSDMIAMIERGTSGAVIVSISTSKEELKDVKTVLADGEYTDKVSGGKFTVKNGVLTGTLEPGAIVVLY
ncbi:MULTISPECIES: alpha-amylase family glycosyl hydrolase [unclassified Ruminococcus]|uniref:alpha-amylase family glycosyl hydrolase n=1 Tax=unclassified Ruminococcus TaxID=2608920 RepID=UPI00210BFE11|nr:MULTISPECIES: alpha-amylase family glycosyl hydrolase [unclassified Ruminococcus]MCQ4023287.1 alpha-amylase [Ruminococcus sp. zg-924]MCQ4115630.1 alpha-amylase [Ruminococcus sp. zg-921]